MKQFVQDVLEGKYDDGLETLASIIHERRKEISRKKATMLAHTLDKGDRIEILKINPSYMIGEKGTILSVKKTRASVEMDKACGRFGRVLNVPLSCVKKIA